MRSVSLALSRRNIDTREGDLTDIRELGVGDGHYLLVARHAHAKAQPQFPVDILFVGGFIPGPGPDLGGAVLHRIRELVKWGPTPGSRVPQRRTRPDGADQLGAPGPAVDDPPLARLSVRRDDRELNPVPVERADNFHFGVLNPVILVRRAI